MSVTQPIVLLISGGWHTPQSYTKLTEALSSSSFEVHVPALGSTSDTRPPSADLESDTALIRAYVEDLVNSGLEILVLMHSYGGQVGTNALSGLSVSARFKEGLLGGVSHLIYMAATAITEGKSMVDTVRDFGHEDLLPLAFDFADDKSCVHRDPKLLLIGADDAVSEEEKDEYVATLGRWNGNCMYQPLTTAHAAWRDGPVTYIHTTGDMTVPLDYQKVFVNGMEEADVKVQRVSVNTGHCPNLTRPKEIAAILRKIADGEAVGDQGEAQTAHRASTGEVEGVIQSVGTAKT
ncbi:alpha/beta-hydrolase [Macroventuria anomochaeta]|uniref:Alpha/beta-hydrolase n=1 Tax=Macroventuria anomochaeta TaxID=301207 RepID=A0ACB6S3S4_9PLEO|nr:alpha/beta-hydrolase [Macroventuria anomochaeta]KAF2628890.1 alpha/beta-hydrolase [Macroventuria anomochaeta]